MSDGSDTGRGAACACDRHLGRCKWFDERKGYGFIVVCDGPSANSDVFVHYKDLKPLVNTRKSLRKGEYVNMKLTEREDGKSQAVEVTGVLGGPLMCDHYTRILPEKTGDPAETDQVTA